MQLLRVSVYCLVPFSAVEMNISCNSSGFFPSSPLTPDADPGDDECPGLWLSLHFFVCDGSWCRVWGDLVPAARQTTASEVVPLAASWDFLT